MALGQFVNITDFWHKKSIKLSDAFEVLITLNNKEEPLVNCTGFTIPKLEYEEETIEYGNVAQVFVTPKYDSCKELTLDFYEYMDDKNNNYSCTLKKVFDYMGYKLNQKFSNGLMTNYGVYNIDKVIPIIQIKVLNNKLWRYKFLYHFENLKIVNYTVYNFDYQSESPCKVTVTLSFETYNKQTIYEAVKYGDTVESKPVEQKEDTTPNGKIEGNPNSHKEDIEQQWQQSINDSDLDMIRNEELLNPNLYELEDLDTDMEPDLAINSYKESMQESDLDMIRQPELEELNAIERELGDIDSTSTSNPDVGDEPSLEEDWRAKAYEAQQATKGNRSPNLQQYTNSETVENIKKNNKDIPGKASIKKENDTSDISKKMVEQSTLWETHKENGETYTDKYIQTNNGHTVDATHNQQQYEYTQRANKQKGQSMSRGPSIETNGPGDTRSSSQEASNESNNAKQAADQREYQRKTDEYAKQNKGNRSAVPPAQNISVAQQTNDTESFYKNGA